MSTKTWLSKELTLDLLAITIHSFNKIYQRISEEGTGRVSPWPVPEDVAREQQATELEQKPESTTDSEPSPQEPAPAPAPAPANGHDYAALHTKAQGLLRDINLAGDVEWITGTLFPHFGVKSLTEVPKTRLPELVDMTEARHTEVKQ